MKFDPTTNQNPGTGSSNLYNQIIGAPAPLLQQIQQSNNPLPVVPAPAIETNYFPLLLASAGALLFFVMRK